MQALQLSKCVNMGLSARGLKVWEGNHSLLRKFFLKYICLACCTKDLFYNFLFLSLNIFVTWKCSLFQLTVIHPRAEPGHEADPKPALEPVNHAQVHDHKVEFKEAKVRAAGFMDNGLGEGTEAIAKTSASKSFIFNFVNWY